MASHPQVVLAGLSLLALAAVCSGQTDESSGVDATAPSDAGDTAVDTATTPDSRDSSSVPDATADVAVDAPCEAGAGRGLRCGPVPQDRRRGGLKSRAATARRVTF